MTQSPRAEDTALRPVWAEVDLAAVRSLRGQGARRIVVAVLVLVAALLAARVGDAAVLVSAAVLASTAITPAHRAVARRVA